MLHGYKVEAENHESIHNHMRMPYREGVIARPRRLRRLKIFENKYGLFVSFDTFAHPHLTVTAPDEKRRKSQGNLWLVCVTNS